MTVTVDRKAARRINKIYRFQFKAFTLTLTMALAMTLLTTLPASAYIPSSRTIVGRLVHNSGKGVYAIEQEVQFRTAGEPLILREHWIVENGETMHLRVSAAQAAKTGVEPTHYEASYHDLRKTAADLLSPQSGMAVRTTADSPEFLEGLFHARSSAGFISSLRRSRVVPASALHDRPHFTKLEQVKHSEEPFVRLGRTAGAVTWIFGDPSPANSAKLNPAIWIEQDAFVVRRVRFPSEAEVSAEHYVSYPNSLRLPRERTVSWANNSVVIRVLSVKHLAQAPSRESTAAAKNTNLPDIAQVKEFYSRFR